MELSLPLHSFFLSCYKPVPIQSFLTILSTPAFKCHLSTVDLWLYFLYHACLLHLQSIKPRKYLLGKKNFSTTIYKTKMSPISSGLFSLNFVVMRWLHTTAGKTGE